jgi:hypothetical protein
MVLPCACREAQQPIHRKQLQADTEINFGPLYAGTDDWSIHKGSCGYGALWKDEPHG